MSGKHLIIHVSNPDRYLQNCFGSMSLANVFETLAEYALKKESVLLVRSEHTTIGVSRPNERYWFYVSWNEGQAQIKFQHWTQSETFRKTRLKQYKQACDEVAAIYRSSPNVFYTGNRAKSSEATLATKNTPPDARAVPVNNVPTSTEFLGSCETCHLRRSEKCSSLRGEVCADYEEAVEISEEAKSFWPEKMLATLYRERAGHRQEKELFRKKHR